jgi:hypothetical protein
MLLCLVQAGTDAVVTGTCLHILSSFVPGYTLLARLNAAYLLRRKGTLGQAQTTTFFKFSLPSCPSSCRPRPRQHWWLRKRQCPSPRRGRRAVSPFSAAALTLAVKLLDLRLKAVAMEYPAGVRHLEDLLIELVEAIT